MLYSNYNAEQILANIRKAKDFQSDDLKMDMSYVIHHMPAVDSLQISEADEVTESTEPKEDTNQMSNAARQRLIENERRLKEEIMELRNEVDKLLGDNRTFVRHNKLLMEENANLKAWKEQHRQEMAVMREQLGKKKDLINHLNLLNDKRIAQYNSLDMYWQKVSKQVVKPNLKGDSTSKFTPQRTPQKYIRGKSKGYAGPTISNVMYMATEEYRDLKSSFRKDSMLRRKALIEDPCLAQTVEENYEYPEYFDYMDNSSDVLLENQFEGISDDFDSNPYRDPEKPRVRFQQNNVDDYERDEDAQAHDEEGDIEVVDVDLT